MNKIVIILSALVVMLIAWDLHSYISQEKIAFIDIGRLQENYNLKKDLEEKGKGRLMQLKNVLDSLALVKKLQPTGVEYTRLDTTIAQLEFQFKNVYSTINEEINVALWKRLNPLMENYGREHHYKLIIGANGGGTVMYGDRSADITNDLIKYVNKDYVSTR